VTGRVSVATSASDVGLITAAMAPVSNARS
jgi:hypothetical protein